MRTPVKYFAALCLALCVASCASSYSATSNATHAASATADSALRGAATQELAPVTVYVVRHAEAEQGDSRDPVLTQAGVVRANALRDRLKGTGIDAIFSTAYIRTRETAGPLAAALDLPIHVYDARDPAPLVQDLYANHRGGTVLIVGHSNTVPAVVEALGGVRPADLAHTEHDPLFRVTARGAGLTAKVTRLRYGARSDAAAP